MYVCIRVCESMPKYAILIGSKCLLNVSLFWKDVLQKEMRTFKSTGKYGEGLSRLTAGKNSFIYNSNNVIFSILRT